MNSTEGIVFNIQRYSIDDGPGIRTTVFLKGCPLKCLWCSNPESQEMKPEITWRFTSCKHCGACEKACPNKAIHIDQNGNVLIDRSLCAACGKCAETCTAGALKISGQKMTVDEVFKVIWKDRVYYQTSDGGVTCSGGEILMQPDFVSALFARCRENGIHTTADTCGFGSAEAMEKILAFCNLVYYDLKCMDPIEHEKGTGERNDVIMSNLKLVLEKDIPVVVRVPLVPDYSYNDENLNALGAFVSGLDKNIPVNLMPYHRYGANKYGMLGRVYALENLKTLTAEELDHAKGVIESYGLKCIVSK